MFMLDNNRKRKEPWEAKAIPAAGTVEDKPIMLGHKAEAAVVARRISGLLSPPQVTAGADLILLKHALWSQQAAVVALTEAGDIIISRVCTENLQAIP